MAESRASGKGRGTRGLLVVFALSVLLPAAILAVLAYGTVEKERRALAAERKSSLESAARLIRRGLVSELRRLKEEEEARPYYQYNPLYFDAKAVGKGLNLFRSPLADGSPNPLALGYFQIEPGGRVQSTYDESGLGQQSAQWLDVPAAGPAQSEREETGEARTDQVREQNELVVEDVNRNLLPQVEEDLRARGGKVKGQFPRQAEPNQRQVVSKKSHLLNAQSRRQIAEVAQGKVDSLESQWRGRENEPVEVVVSPFHFQRNFDDGGILAYRYADVPNPEEGRQEEPFLRIVQGFKLDLDHVRTTLLPELARTHLDVEGARAALLAEGDEPPEGDLVFEDSVSHLPGHRVVVLDADGGWVRRRVARLSTTLLLAAGVLLLVIVGGLAFTMRAVRTEMGLAARKSDFVAAVTHELRTPLTGIKMYADMLQAGWVRDDATREEYIGFMAAETDRLARLVNRVLDFARSERGEARTGAVDLAGPIREVERDFGPYVAEKGYDLVVAIGTDRPALADRDAVKQVLLNLLENAVKYAGGAEDRTLTIRAAEEGVRVALSVEDRGPGVPAAEREAIFEDFYRPGEELTREVPGAGLGLALVRRLADSMGGEVQLRETPGGGATFVLLLRAAPA